MPEGELLWTSDEDDVWEMDSLGWPWREVRRSKGGRTEYASDRYLEGADTSPRGSWRHGGGHFVVVYGVNNSCANLREGPGYDADVVDCVPNGTGLPADPDTRVSVDSAVWRPLEWEGQWVWADERLLLEIGDYDYWSSKATAGELPAPPLELSDDIALLGIATIYEEGGGYGEVFRSQEMFRIRRGPDGEMMREMLLSSERTDPPGPSGYVRWAIATQDLSRIVVADWEALYESSDGGVTWSYLDSLELDSPRLRLSFLKGENDGDPGQQILSVGWFKHLGGDTIFTLHPSGERETLLPIEPWDTSRLWQMREDPLLHLTYGDDRFAPDAWVSDDEILGAAWLRQWALTRGGIDVVGDSCCSNHEIQWPAIYDLDAQVIRSLAIPPGMLRPEEYLWPLVGLQRGPFLRVSLPDGCKNVRAEPGLDAAILDCAAEGVLLRDLGDQAEHGGRTWHNVRTPAGIEGWSSSRYLE